MVLFSVVIMSLATVTAIVTSHIKASNFERAQKAYSNGLLVRYTSKASGLVLIDDCWQMAYLMYPATET